MRYETIVTVKAKAYVNGSYGLVDDWYDTIIEEHEKALTSGYDDRPGPQVAADVLIDFLNENDFGYYDGQTTDDKQNAIAMYTDALEVAASIDAYNKFIDEWELNYNLPELTYTIELVDWDADEQGDYRHCNQYGRLATFNSFGSEWYDEERPALSMALERTDNERVHKMADEFEKRLMTMTMELLRRPELLREGE